MEQSPRYLKHFQEGKSGKFRLRGPVLLVEVLPKAELKTKGGLVIASADAYKATANDFRNSMGLVLAVGSGYSDGEPCECKPGQVIMVPYNPTFLSEFPGLQDYTQNSIALVNENNVILVYDSLEAYEAASR